MYNHLPKVDSTRSFEGSHRSPRSEAAELRRMHREHVAAERARNAEGTLDAPAAAAAASRARSPCCGGSWGIAGSAGGLCRNAAAAPEGASPSCLRTLRREHRIVKRAEPACKCIALLTMRAARHDTSFGRPLLAWDRP